MEEKEVELAEEKPEEKVEEKKEEGKDDDTELLRRFDRGFNKWLNALSEKELEKVVSRVLRNHPNEKTCFEYIECVRSMEGTVRFCNKCRRTGCEKCDYLKCLRYVVRWQKPADWRRRTSQTAVMGALRFLRGN